jgi:hypothetical protein
MERLALILAVVLALIGLGSVWLGVQHAAHSGNLAAEGVTTDAEIVARFLDTSAEKTRMVGDRATETTSVDSTHVRYRFLLEDGTPFEKEESVDPAFYDEAEIGTVWQVTYLPSDPEIASLYGDRFAQSASILTWVAGIALALSALLFAYRFRRRLGALTRPAA